MNNDRPDDRPRDSLSDPCSAMVPLGAVHSPQVEGYLGANMVRDARPFVAQDGQFLYLVAQATRGWVVAELKFDPESCVFVLRRQTEYEWPREALGRLLSRVIAPGSADDREMTRMSAAFTDWLATQFASRERPT